MKEHATTTDGKTVSIEGVAWIRDGNLRLGKVGEYIILGSSRGGHWKYTAFSPEQWRQFLEDAKRLGS